jgi:hypothetical protein
MESTTQYKHSIYYLQIINKVILRLKPISSGNDPKLPGKQQQCCMTLFFILNIITAMIANKCSMIICTKYPTMLEFKRWINSAIYYFKSSEQCDRLDLAADYHSAEFENLQLKNSFTKLGV